MTDAARPAPPPAGASPKEAPKPTFQGLWDLCDQYRMHAGVLRDVARDAGNEAIAARWASEMAGFEAMQVLINRIGDDAFIKDRLRVLAEEQAAHEAIDNGEGDQ